ncbi:myb-binding protein 1A [Sorex araneus]|uniref:myb-binding protein 1A n=1 Tax=Sorex araneus TaxID=42254 RepID=UPI002433E699|nr:myb-binding protein 1A [Sorex araneus]
MAEMESVDGAETKPSKEKMKNGHRPADRQGLLKHSREFLDFFWDIAKPQQETRLEATEKLLEYLRTRPKGSEMKYALKRLITGLGVGRETARPCYSLALAQLLQSFEDIPLCSILEQIQEKHNLQKVKKTMMRPALFGNLFGVLALFQSGRLVKDPEALLKSVQLLQTLAEHSNHLQEQPQKALVDILSEVPVATLKEILPKVLTDGLNSVLSSPEHLALFLLAREKVPVKLKKLMGLVDLFSAENIPRLIGVLKTAATSTRKELQLPDVVLNLLRLALREDKFPQFWNDVIDQGLMKKRCWPANYMCFRLLGAALPLLSTEQLQLAMQGDLIRVLGEHVLTSQGPGKYRFAPEMTKYVNTFLEGCREDPERQLAAMVAFTSVTNHGQPVTSTSWRVVESLSVPALRAYAAWLRDMFLQPRLDSLVDFSTSHQEKNKDTSSYGPEYHVLRLRKWIIFRLVNLVGNLHVEKEEALVEEVVRFCFFHAFFETKKPEPQIPETKQQFSIPVAAQTREMVSSAFFSLLQALNTQFKAVRERALVKQPWSYRLVQFADMLLSHSHHVAALKPFTKPQHQAWNRMLQTLKELEALSSDSVADTRAKGMAFQHLFLFVGIHLFKNPEESCDLLGDIQTCMTKSMGEKARRKRSKATSPQEPPWVEVLVEILLALLAQPSHLVRLVTRTVFSHICSHLTPRALQLILDVLNPEKSQDDEEEETVVVTDDSQRLTESAEDQDSDSEDADSGSESDGESGEESGEEERDGDVDQGFREQLMAVLQAGKALGDVDGEDGDDDDEELGDEAMMALDQNLSSLFAEQKLRIQARRDEKNKLQKEKALRRNFQIRVLDLIRVMVTKQPENPLVLELLKPLLDIIRCTMRSSSTPQEKDLLQKTARIFSQDLFHARQYCRDLDNAEEMLHPRLAWLVQQAGRQVDASISLYYFNGSLYLLRVLKGNAVHKAQGETTSDCDKPGDPKAPSGLNLSFVVPLYSSALSSFLTRRNSPLTAPMFLSLFTRHPVLCKELLPVIVRHMADPVRPRQQGQACALLQKMLSMGELRPCFEDADWQKLISQVLAKVTENVRMLGQAENKTELQKELSSLELLNTVIRNVRQRKLSTDLTGILAVLRGQQPALQQRELEVGSSRLHDLYWQAMKLLGVQRPKLEKKDAKEVSSDTQSPISTKRKKKGFLPETKKRKKRKAEGVTPEDAKPAPPSGDQPPSTGKKRKRRRRNKAKGQVPAQSPVNGVPATESPVPAPPTTSPSAPAKTPKQPKKKQKLSQVNGISVLSPTDPVGKQQQQQDPPAKAVSGKTPQTPQPRKKAKLSLASGSPSLPQKEAKKKKVQARKGDKP